MGLLAAAATHLSCARGAGSVLFTSERLARASVWLSILVSLHFHSGCASMGSPCEKECTENSVVWRRYKGGDSSGTVIEQGFTERGKFLPHGKYVELNAAGKVSAVGEMLLGERSGLWMLWHAGGTLRNIGHYSNGLECGDWQSWDENGRLISRGSYASGRMGGEWIFFYPEGPVSSRGCYSDGKKIGEWSEFYASGGVMCTGSYGPGSNSSGMYGQNVRVGAWVFFDERGEVKERVTYKDGVKEK